MLMQQLLSSISISLDLPQSTESDGSSGGLMDQHIFAPLPISEEAAENIEIEVVV